MAAVTDATGFPVVYAIAFTPALVEPALVCVVAGAIVALPGYLIARTPPSMASPAD